MILGSKELFDIVGKNVIGLPVPQDATLFHVVPNVAHLTLVPIENFGGRPWMEKAGFRALVRINPPLYRHEQGRSPVREDNFPPLGHPRVNQDGTIWPENLGDLVQRPNWTLSDDLREALRL